MINKCLHKSVRKGALYCPNCGNKIDNDLQLIATLLPFHSTARSKFKLSTIISFMTIIVFVIMGISITILWRSVPSPAPPQPIDTQPLNDYQQYANEVRQREQDNTDMRAELEALTKANNKRAKALRSLGR